jgi:hypothetical protein
MFVELLPWGQPIRSAAILVQYTVALAIPQDWWACEIKGAGRKRCIKSRGCWSRRSWQSLGICHRSRGTCCWCSQCICWKRCLKASN